MRTGEPRYDGFFARAAAAARRGAEAAARARRLTRPLALGIELPAEHARKDVLAAVREAARDEARAGARFRVAVERVKEPAWGAPAEGPRLTRFGQKPLSPWATLILDAVVETLREAIAARAELDAAAAASRELRREAEKLVAASPEALAARGAAWRDTVVAELQARWTALGQAAERAQAEAAATSTLVRDLASAASPP